MRYQLTQIIHRGPNRDDHKSDICTIAGLVGGNGKTGPTIDLLVVPWSAVKAVRSVPSGLHSTAYTKAYVGDLKTEIGDVCGSCILSGMVADAKRVQLKLKKCYAQHNFQNAMQPTAMVRATSGDGPARGTFDADAWGKILVAAGLLGIERIRSAVAGDLGMLPERIATELINATPQEWDWLGYTHQWHRSPWLKGTHMASTQGAWSAAESATRRGWRPFHVQPVHLPIPESAEFTVCPAQMAKARGLAASCAGCSVPCNGTRSSHGATVTIDHGPGARWKTHSVFNVA